MTNVADRLSKRSHIVERVGPPNGAAFSSERQESVVRMVPPNRRAGLCSAHREMDWYGNPRAGREGASGTPGGARLLQRPVRQRAARSRSPAATKTPAARPPPDGSPPRAARRQPPSRTGGRHATRLQSRCGRGCSLPFGLEAITQLSGTWSRARAAAWLRAGSDASSARRERPLGSEQLNPAAKNDGSMAQPSFLDREAA